MFGKVIHLKYFSNVFHRIVFIDYIYIDYIFNCSFVVEENGRVFGKRKVDIIQGNFLISFLFDEMKAMNTNFKKR